MRHQRNNLINSKNTRKKSKISCQRHSLPLSLVASVDTHHHQQQRKRSTPTPTCYCSIPTHRFGGSILACGLDDVPPPCAGSLFRLERLLLARRFGRADTWFARVLPGRGGELRVFRFDVFVCRLLASSVEEEKRWLRGGARGEQVLATQSRRVGPSWERMELQLTMMCDVQHLDQKVERV